MKYKPTCVDFMANGNGLHFRYSHNSPNPAQAMLWRECEGEPARRQIVVWSGREAFQALQWFQNLRKSNAVDMESMTGNTTEKELFIAWAAVGHRAILI